MRNWSIKERSANSNAPTTIRITALVPSEAIRHLYCCPTCFRHSLQPFRKEEREMRKGYLRKTFQGIPELALGLKLPSFIKQFNSLSDPSSEHSAGVPLRRGDGVVSLERRGSEEQRRRYNREKDGANGKRCEENPPRGQQTRRQ